MLIVEVFAETGLIGTTIFLAAHVAVFRNTASIAATDDGRTRPISFALFVAGISLTLTIMISKGMTALRFPWYWLSLAMAASLVKGGRFG
jgi:O-antigen ligase